MVFPTCWLQLFSIFHEWVGDPQFMVILVGMSSWTTNRLIFGVGLYHSMPQCPRIVWRDMMRHVKKQKHKNAQNLNYKQFHTNALISGATRIFLHWFSSVSPMGPDAVSHRGPDVGGSHGQLRTARDSGELQHRWVPRLEMRRAMQFTLDSR